MSARKRVLVVEDHADLQEILSIQLSGAGYHVDLAQDGKEALEKIKNTKPDLVLLDLMLPKLSGLDVCKEMKKNESTRTIPAIMLTAKGDEADIVAGLELGADDYVTKPFGTQELLARIKAVLRRSERPTLETPLEKIEFESLEIYPQTYEVFLGKKKTAFTLTEFQLLFSLIKNKGKLFTRDQLIDLVRGHQVVIVDRNIDVHMSSIRKKLGNLGEHILTVRGVGYRFVDE